MRFSIDQRKFIDSAKGSSQKAVVGADKVLTWSELEANALEFESKLIKSGAMPGDLVVIFGHKQSAYISAICACIKRGCPYIPIDDIYPQERVSKILEISAANFLINIESEAIERIVHKEHADSRVSLSEDLVYIIFTSGSTGDPKGVQISKENIVSMLNWMHEDFALPLDTVFMNQAPFSFDLSVYELMYFLNYGKTIILNSRQEIGSPDFFDRLRKHKINVWVSTPSFAWSQCINENFNSNHLDELKYFLFCGEVLTVKLVKKLKSLFPQAVIMNTYGPTEATVATTMIEITSEIVAKYESLPIGYPKKGSQVYPDDTGQICIVGDNVMVGYLNAPELNAVKMFTSNGLRGFKTGDLGFVQDDLLFCKGRMDDQIKLHGYRIELSEIDQALLKVNHVKEAAVIPVERGGEVIRLAAFLKLVDHHISHLELKNEIQKSLPYYMVPSEYFLLDELPLSPNHKVDRKRLKAMYSDKVIKKWEQL